MDDLGVCNHKHQEDRGVTHSHHACFLSLRLTQNNLLENNKIVEDTCI